jgi:hypothetical protein
VSTKPTAADEATPPTTMTSAARQAVRRPVMTGQPQAIPAEHHASSAASSGQDGEAGDGGHGQHAHEPVGQRRLLDGLRLVGRGGSQPRGLPAQPGPAGGPGLELDLGGAGFRGRSRGG